MVLENQLVEGVLSSMATNYEHKGTLAERLLKSIWAGRIPRDNLQENDLQL